MNWRYTNIQHGPRLEIGVTPNEYCVLDLFYQSQVSPVYSVDGWSENTYSEIADALGVSKGTVYKMVDRFVAGGLMEVNPANPKQKRTTEKWFTTAYERVSKVNAKVSKVNDTRFQSERKSFQSERHYREERYIKEKKKEKERRSAGEPADSIQIVHVQSEDNDIDDAFATIQSDALKKEKSSAKKEKPQTLDEAMDQARLRLEGMRAKPEAQAEIFTPSFADDSPAARKAHRRRHLAYLTETPDGREDWSEFLQESKLSGKLSHPGRVLRYACDKLPIRSVAGTTDGLLAKIYKIAIVEASKEQEATTQAKTRQLKPTTQKNNHARFQPKDNPADYDYSKFGNSWVVEQ